MRLRLWIIASSLLLASACTQDTTSGTLGLIHEGATESANLVLADGFDTPMLESALPPGAAATPIEIEVEGELAIAWRRYEQTPEQRRESDVMALWRVLDRVPVSSTSSTSSTSAQVPVVVSGAELELEGIDVGYLLMDLDNRMELGESFDRDLWEQWQFFIESHAVCP